MRVRAPELTEGRRAGLLAAVSAYSLTRLSGTLPRPALDQAVVSGTTMAIAYVAASTTTSAAAARRAAACRRSGGATRAPSWRPARWPSGRASGRCSSDAAPARRRPDGRRLPVSVGHAGAVAEAVTVSAAAGAAISVADLVGLALPEAAAPAAPGGRRRAAWWSRGGGRGDVDAPAVPRLLRAAARPRAHRAPRAQLPAGIEPARRDRARRRRRRGSRSPRSGSRRTSADRLAGVLDGSDRPDVTLRVLSHAVVVAGFVAGCGAGLGLYLTRFTVQNRLLEERVRRGAQPLRRDRRAGLGVRVRDARSRGSAVRLAGLHRRGADGRAGRAGDGPGAGVRPARAAVRAAPARRRGVVEEMERVGAFDKGVIVLAVPTGDGYVSYVQTETVELLTAGDCATVIVPYAQIPSTWAFFAVGRRAAAYYALYARAISARLRATGRTARLFLFGESLGSIVALDAFGTDLVAQLESLGFAGGLYIGVPRYSHVDQVLRPRDPAVHVAAGLQYAAAPGAGASQRRPATST